MRRAGHPHQVGISPDLVRLPRRRVQPGDRGHRAGMRLHQRPDRGRPPLAGLPGAPRRRRCRRRTATRSAFPGRWTAAGHWPPWRASSRRSNAAAAAGCRWSSPRLRDRALLQRACRLPVLDAFAKWLAARRALGTVVETVGQVIGGPVRPVVTAPAAGGMASLIHCWKPSATRAGSTRPTRRRRDPLPSRCAG